ncbi:MAG TPA: N-acetylmuramic acid 6-phosphate etherase, partial [Acidocella sp.]
GARTVAIVNNPGSPLLDAADVPVTLATGAEMVAGSTRMAAGTAQKIALNILSTLAAAHLGHVVNGEMVNLQADNLKLRHRAVGIVGRLSGADAALATDCLEQAGFDIPSAALLAAGAPDLAAARAQLGAHGGDLRRALQALQATTPPMKRTINR